VTEIYNAWLAASPREARAFETIDDALATIAQSTGPGRLTAATSTRWRRDRMLLKHPEIMQAAVRAQVQRVQ